MNTSVKELNDPEFDQTQAHVYVDELKQQLINIQSGGDPNHVYQLTDVLRMMDAHTKVKADELLDMLDKMNLLKPMTAQDTQVLYGRCGIGD